jgi:hypothetical protein
MKQMRELNNTPHCTRSKSYARFTHEEVHLYMRIWHCSYSSTSVYKDAHKEGWKLAKSANKGEICKYINFYIFISYVCDNLFFYYICLTH